MPLSAGTRLGPFVVDSLIGAGGMGEVYRAHDSRLNRAVAIKVLAPDVATPDRVERFEREARAASALNHPNILTIHDVGREGDTAYIAMEWVDGQTLRELLRAGPILLRRSIQLAQQLAEGLAKAHAAGIVHRDLKPENVMVTRDGLAKIVDFGLAKRTAVPARSDDATVSHVGRTDLGVVMGTVGYMSPEQASGRPVDYRSDQFALGLLIYELVTRTRPFERPTSAQSLAATIEAEPTPVESLTPEVPPHLAEIVARCLAKDPAQRYESTRDLARDLKSILDSPSPGAVVTPARGTRLRAQFLALIAAIVLLIGAGVAGWMWRSRSSATKPTETQRPLVAVRSFRNLSADPQQAYFAAGMTEEIRGQLSQVSSLRLLSRNALDAYKDADSSRVARELGIRNLVDGSVRVDGNRVRISAELVDASTNETLWSDSYDRQLADILAVQSDVAVQIARALHANLSPHEQKRVGLRPTNNLEAYRLYLQSQQMGILSDRAQNLEAMELLRKAFALDPRFAVAKARLAYRLVFMGLYDDASYIEQGIAEAHAALRIDPSLPNGYSTLGTAYSIKGMDAQARQAFLRALELDPNLVPAMHNLSIHESTFGRLDESLYWGRRSFELSGKTGNDYYHVAVPLSTIREDEGTRKWLLDAERRFPSFHRVQGMLTLLDVVQGRTPQALARSEALRTSSPDDEEVKFLRADLAFLTNSNDLEKSHEALMARAADSFTNVYESVRLRSAYALQKRGDSARAATLLTEAERIATEKIDKGDQTPMQRTELAAAAVLRGDHSAALVWLARAYDAGCREYGVLERDPILAALGSNSRFRHILERMRNDVDAQRARARERGLLDLDGLLAPRK